MDMKSQNLKTSFQHCGALSRTNIFTNRLVLLVIPYFIINQRFNALMHSCKFILYNSSLSHHQLMNQQQLMGKMNQQKVCSKISLLLEITWVDTRIETIKMFDMQ